MRVSVLALDGVFNTGLTATLDAFATANRMSAKLFGGTPRFDVTTVSVRRTVRTAHGLTVPTERVKPSSKPDRVILPAVVAGSPSELIAKLDRADVREARAQLVTWSKRGVLIGAACMGTFVLAETGLLDERPSATTWSLAPLFRQRYPRIAIDEARVVVPSNIGATAAAAMGHLDLALWIIRQTSPELASMVSRYLLANVRASQASYIIPKPPSAERSGHPAV